jgi:hypothetical protein
MSSYINLFQPYTSVWLSEEAKNGIQDILPSLKRKSRGWNASRIINVAIFEFVRTIETRSEEDFQELFERYEKAKVATQEYSRRKNEHVRKSNKEKSEA